jgi:cytochrome c oxidase assembly factor 3
MPLYIHRIPRSSYYDQHYRQSAALIRARRPYVFKNALTGVSIFAFAIGVCMLFIHPNDVHMLNALPTDAFTIRAVAQDEFEDVKVPDGPRKA